MKTAFQRAIRPIDNHSPTTKNKPQRETANCPKHDLFQPIPVKMDKYRVKSTVSEKKCLGLT